jgi:hypothetical protein
MNKNPDHERGQNGDIPVLKPRRTNAKFNCPLQRFERLIGAAEDTTGAGREFPRSYSTSNPLATVGVDPQIDMDRVF